MYLRENCNVSCLWVGDVGSHKTVCIQLRGHNKYKKVVSIVTLLYTTKN